MRIIVGIAAAVLLIFGAASVTVAAGSAYELTVTGAIETPTETVEIEGSEYDIDEVAVIDAGDPIELQVTSAENYYVYLYNTDGKHEHSEYMSADKDTVTMGDADDELDTSALDPGTYMLSLEPDDKGREAVTPVVVQGYNVDLAYPTTAEQGNEIAIEATVEPIDDLDQPETLDVAIWEGDDVTEVTLDHEGGTNYRTTISLSNVGAGTYNVYGAVVGDERVEGYPTSLAVENGASLTVTSDETDTDGGGTDGTAGDDSSDTDNETDAANESDADDGTADDRDATSEGNESTDRESGNATETGADAGDDERDADDGNTSDEVIKPSEHDDTAPDETDPDGLGAPVAIPILVTIATLRLVVTRRNGS